MIKLETAKALKEAGLVWEPEMYDEFMSPRNESPYRVDGYTLYDKLRNGDFYFLPRLDQILAEIENRGKIYTLTSNGRDNYNVLVWFWSDEAAEINFGCGWCPDVDFDADGPDEAAAQALLWILQQEVADANK